MSEAEFDRTAASIAAELDGAALDQRVAAACRGSGNPAALAWLAEGLGLNEHSRAIDLGAGLGGPAAWISRRYGCTVIALEPAGGAATGADALFDLCVVRGEAAHAPFRDDSFEVALLLGVISVVDDAAAVLREARRVGARLGLLDYCSTNTAPVRAGGSEFRSSAALEAIVESAGWVVEQAVDLTLPAPASWDEAADAIDPDIDAEASASEAEVVAAIEAGIIAPRMLIAARGDRARHLTAVSSSSR
ncbi:MAG: class I SAM-dependent methyltransferase [Acidimicrobiia bacterium]